MLTLECAEEIRDLTTDVHNTPEYMRLFQGYLGWQAIYAYYKKGKDYVLIPYFKREIKETEYYDLVGPWYFGGPICNDKGIFNRFLEEFNEWCTKNNIVSEFQRLNPLLENHKLYEHNIFYDRDVVYVSLSKSHEQIKNEYSRHARKNINKAKSNDLFVFKSEAEEYQRIFVDLYAKNMLDKKTNDFYFFNQEFYNKLFSTFNVALFHVKYKNKIICSSLEIGGDNKILYDYLRGTDHNYLTLRPNDIIIDEIIVWARKAGYDYFVIGGGNTKHKDDTQLRFKKNFSSTTKPFYVYKKVHNKRKYNELCRGINPIYELADYFPEY